MIAKTVIKKGFKKPTFVSTYSLYLPSSSNRFTAIMFLKFWISVQAYPISNHPGAAAD